MSQAHNNDNGGALFFHHPKAATHEDMPTESSLAQVYVQYEGKASSKYT